MIYPLCNQLFKNPKYLPCYYPYYEECLEKMQEYSKITCLKCRNETKVPTGGVKDLPSNYFMNNLVNKVILNYKLENETELRCEECDEDDSVVVFCTDCKLFLCHFCKESHKYSKSHCSHNLISLTELRSNKDLKSKLGMRLICSKIYLLFLPELLKIFPYYSLKYIASYHLLFPNYSALTVRK